MKKYYYYYYFDGMPYTENIYNKEANIEAETIDELLQNLDDEDYFEFEHLVLRTMCNQFFRIDLKSGKMSDVMKGVRYEKNLSLLKSVIEILVYYPLDDDEFKEEVNCLFPFTKNPDELIEDFKIYRSIFYHKIAEDIQDKTLHWDDPARLYHELLLNTRNKVYEKILSEVG